MPKGVYPRNEMHKEICRRAVLLQAHHIKSFSLYPKLRLNIKNGITLCLPCHKKTDTYLRKPKETMRMGMA